LIERGFEVTVLERRDIAGGKARSVRVTHDGVLRRVQRGGSPGADDAHRLHAIR
jgi:uncharacterized protein with NAD-binding domain and iron-sulfur cluster